MSDTTAAKLPTQDLPSDLTAEEIANEAYVAAYEREFPASRIREAWERAGAIRPRLI